MAPPKPHWSGGLPWQGRGMPLCTSCSSCESMTKKPSGRCERLFGRLLVCGAVLLMMLYGWLVLMPVLPDAAPGMKSVLIVYCQPCAPLAVLLLWRIQAGDPGRVRSIQHRGPDFEPCKVCGELRPPGRGSHHCRTCGECVFGFDHHCGILGVCIAYNNRLSFVALLGVGFAAALQVLYCAALCASWELSRGCAGGGDGCAWFRTRMALQYGVAILVLCQMGFVLLMGLGLQLVLLAMGLTFHEWNEHAKSKPSGSRRDCVRACVRLLRGGCGRLVLALQCCLPARCLLASQHALEALHEVGEGRVPKQALESAMALGVVSSLETARYAALMSLCAFITICNFVMLWLLPSGLSGPAGAADALGTAAAAAGCAVFAHRVSYSRKRLLGALSFRRHLHDDCEALPAPAGGPPRLIGARSHDAAEDESGSLIGGDVATPGRWCEQCGARWQPLIVHCTSCGVCVPRRDHHCGLFGECIGSHNRLAYMGLFFFTLMGCGTTLHIVWRRQSTILLALWADLQRRKVPVLTDWALVREYAELLVQPRTLAKEAVILFGAWGHVIMTFAMGSMLMQQVIYYVYAEQIVNADIASRLFTVFGKGGWGAHSPPTPLPAAKPC